MADFYAGLLSKKRRKDRSSDGATISKEQGPRKRRSFGVASRTAAKAPSAAHHHSSMGFASQDSGSTTTRLVSFRDVENEPMSQLTNESFGSNSSIPLGQRSLGSSNGM
jgi:hypothetical protein